MGAKTIAMKPDDILDYPDAPEPTPSYYDTLYEQSPWYGKILLEMLKLTLALLFLVPVLIYWSILGLRYLYRNLIGSNAEHKANNDIPTSI